MIGRLVVVLSLGCLAGCGADKSDTPSASATSAKPAPSTTVTTASASVSASPPAATAKYKNEAGGYEIDFHGETPAESVKDDPNGGSWHEAAVGNGVALIEYGDYTNAGEAEGTMKVFMPTRDPEAIKVDKEISVQGQKGRDIEMTLKSGKVFWIRFVQLDKRLYKIGVVYSDDKTKAQSFVDSFRITKAGAGASASASASAASAPTAATAPPQGAMPKPPTPPKPAPQPNNDVF